MKKIIDRTLLGIVLFVAWCSLSNAAAVSPDAYHIVFLKGSVKLDQAKNSLHVGDTITKPDFKNLKFQSKDALLDVFNLDEGRIVLRADPKKKNTDGELFYVVSSIIAPKKYAMSTRGGAINNIQDLRTILLKHPLLLLNGESIVKINPVAFPMNKDTFFYVTYTHNGEDINKRLDFHDDELKFSFTEIFTIDGKPINAKKQGKFDLTYYNAKNSSQTNVGSMEYLVPDNTLIKKQVTILLKLLRQSGDNEKNILSQLSSFLLERYGYVSDYDLQNLLKAI